MKFRTPMTIGAAVVMTLGCSDTAVSPTLSPTSPSFAKGGGGPPPPSDPTLRWEVPTVSDGSLKIQGSSNALEAASITTGTAQAYVFDDGVCGASGILFEGNGGGDAYMNPARYWSHVSKAEKGACGGTPPALRYDLPTGSVTVSDEGGNIWAVGAHDHPGRPGIATFYVGSSCGVLRYGSTDLTQRNLPQVAATLVSPPGAKRQWRVQSTADASTGQHLAYCTASGVEYDMPFIIYIYEK